MWWESSVPQSLLFWISSLLSSLSFRPGDPTAYWRTLFCVAQESSVSVCVQLNLPSSCRKSPPPPNFIISLQGITVSLVLISQKPGSYTLFCFPTFFPKGTRLWILPLECTLSVPSAFTLLYVSWSQIIISCLCFCAVFLLVSPVAGWSCLNLVHYSVQTFNAVLSVRPELVPGPPADRHVHRSRGHWQSACGICGFSPPWMTRAERLLVPVGGGLCLPFCSPLLCDCFVKYWNLHLCNCLWFCLPQAWNILSQSYGLQCGLSLNAIAQGSFLKPLSLLCPSCLAK